MSLLVFNDLLTKMCNKIQGDNKYLYITGDFNVNTLPHMRRGPSTQEFTKIFSSNYCFPFINKPTRVMDHSASLIDNIYSNIPPHNCSTGILKCSISDHYGIFCIDNYFKISNNETQISKRSFCNKILQDSKIVYGMNHGILFI